MKQALKNAILDDGLPNEHDAEIDFLMERAKQMGLTPV